MSRDSCERCPELRHRRFTDVDGVARYVDVSVHFVRRLVLERRIPHYKVGGLLRFDLAEVDAWMATLQREARVEPRRT